MRARVYLRMSYLPAGLLVMSVPLAPRCARAQINQPVPKLELKDPTPREVDLEKKLGVAPASPIQQPSSASVAEYNHRRQELILRASHQVVALASTLQKALASHRSGESFAPEIEVTASIRSLADNIRSALMLKQGGAAGASTAVTKNSSSAMATTSETSATVDAHAASLLELARDLNAEAARSGADTLALRSIRDAEHISLLAEQVQSQLKTM